MKTLESRVEDVESTVISLNDRIVALESGAGTGAGTGGGTATESEPDSRLDQVATIVERFLENVGNVYDGAATDLESLKALRTPTA